MISPTQSYAAPTSNAIYIRGGLEGAKNYPVTPGYTAWLIDEENKKFFIKFVNSSGIPTIKEFKYEEVETPDTQASSGESSKYVLKEDFDKLYNKIEKSHLNQIKFFTKTQFHIIDSNLMVQIKF